MELYQRVKNFRGTNANYFHAADLRKLQTGKAEFVIMSKSELDAAKREGAYSFYCRGDASLTRKDMLAAIKTYKGILITA